MSDVYRYSYSIRLPPRLDHHLHRHAWALCQPVEIYRRSLLDRIADTYN